MPFEILRNDITNMQVDAIVNTASPRPKIGLGVDNLIHKKAGPMLLAARIAIGSIPMGGAAVTAGYRLPAKYVIHTVTPVWQGGNQGEAEILAGCYRKCMELALKKGCRSIAFPLMSAGNHGFPKPLAMQTALNAISAFLMKEEMMVYLVVFSRDAFHLSEQLFQGISSFIDDQYTQQKNLEAYGVADKCSLRQAQQQEFLREQMRRRQEEAFFAQEECLGAAPPPSPAPARKQPGKTAAIYTMPQSPAPALSLEELMRQEDKGFSQALLELIDASGKKDSQIYTRANISRQHFSKIRNNPLYKPTKATALALAIALELDLEQTRELIGRAGFALTKSSKFDLIIMYFIQTGNYNMYDINAALFEFDQTLLGA